MLVKSHPLCFDDIDYAKFIAIFFYNLQFAHIVCFLKINIKYKLLIKNTKKIHKLGIFNLMRTKYYAVTRHLTLQKKKLNIYFLPLVLVFGFFLGLKIFIVIVPSIKIPIVPPIIPFVVLSKFLKNE